MELVITPIIVVAAIGAGIILSYLFFRYFVPNWWQKPESNMQSRTKYMINGGMIYLGVVAIFFGMLIIFPPAGLLIMLPIFLLSFIPGLQDVFIAGYHFPIPTFLGWMVILVSWFAVGATHGNKVWKKRLHQSQTMIM